MSDPVLVLDPSAPAKGARDLASAGTPAIRVDGVRKRYGEVEVLKGVDLAVATGQFTAIINRTSSF